MEAKRSVRRLLMQQPNWIHVPFFQPVPGRPVNHGIISQQHRDPGDWIPDALLPRNAGHTTLAVYSPGSSPGFGSGGQLCVITCHLAGGVSAWAHVLPACHPLHAGCHPLPHSHPQGQILPGFILRGSVILLYTLLYFAAINPPSLEQISSVSCPHRHSQSIRAARLLPSHSACAYLRFHSVPPGIPSLSVWVRDIPSFDLFYF